MKRSGIVDYSIPSIEKASSANYVNFAVRINFRIQWSMCISDEIAFQVALAVL